METVKRSVVARSCGEGEINWGGGDTGFLRVVKLLYDTIMVDMSLYICPNLKMYNTKSEH